MLRFTACCRVVKGTVSPAVTGAPAGAGAGTGAGAAARGVAVTTAGARPAACSTSAATRRPWGPLPVRPSRATPSWCASLRARGLAITRPFAAEGAGTGAAAAATGAAGAGIGAGAAAGAGAGVGATAGAAVGPPLASSSCSSASVSTTRPMVSPTGAVAPAGSSTAPRKPASNDSTSMSALSDSTTSTDSPRSTRSPGFLSHSTIFPSVIVELRAGMKISWVAIRRDALRWGRS